ncbi:hypothetical protein GMO_02130 [Gluconobacter morbifer G707]|uniref:Uncharacterized protein n=1 Tax=Gluconobacter morbifer G707 TaxID=1088869 RepID=G6XFE8_9PROT|nr:hypothetical protein GMO_02130 [Gluconobacter morbifer G707]
MLVFPAAGRRGWRASKPCGTDESFRVGEGPEFHKDVRLRVSGLMIGV